MPNSHERRVQVDQPEARQLRLDKYVSDVLQLFPRSQIDKRQLVCRLGKKVLKWSYKLQGGEVLDLVWQDPPEPDFAPENIPLTVVFENDAVLVVNKPRGMVVHPAHGNHTGTLVQALLYRINSLKAAFGPADQRPGIVHRLDKDTTGLIITAKDPATLEMLAAQFRHKTTEKTYFAVIKGRLAEDRGRLTTGFGRDPRDRKKFAVWAEGGKIADTHYRVRAVVPGYSLVQLFPRTGRTHQLRVHMAHLRCPILGDPIYSQKDRRYPAAPLMLHSWSLKIQLPGDDNPRRFTADFPADFLDFVHQLGLDSGLPRQA